MNRIARMYDDWGKPELAEWWRTKARGKAPSSASKAIPRE
jgi:hypothetical protein